MRIAFVILNLLSIIPATAAEPPVFQAVKIESDKLPKTANNSYRLMIPDRTGSPTDSKLPLVIYLHGAGSKGGDNTKPMAELLPALLAKPEMRMKFPCYVLVPQCKDGTTTDGRPNNCVNWAGQKDNIPAKWEVADAEPSEQLSGAMVAADEVMKKHPIDPSRVYLTGVSMGGSGACNWAAREPERFAAVIAACGLGETSKAKELDRTPLRLFHGSDDPVAPVDRSRKLAEAVKAAGGKATLTEFTGVGHNINGKVFSDSDHATLKWLFEQKREVAK